MADPLSVTSALVGLVAFSFGASKALRDTIQSFKHHPKYVRDLSDELVALEGVLKLLEQSLISSGEADYAMLQVPIQRCGRSCDEFKQALQKCLKQDSSDRSSFRGWLRIRWIGSDIYGFKDTLAGYKSTIAIAMAGINLRTTKTSLSVIQEYRAMIQSTTTDLNDRLYNIDSTMTEGSDEADPSKESVDRAAMLAERASTVRCLEICGQVSSYIEKRRSDVADKSESDTISTTESDSTAGLSSAQQVMDDSLSGCRLNIKSASAQLSQRLEYLRAILSGTSLNTPQASSDDTDERGNLAKEIEGVRQCLDICKQATEQAEHARINVMQDIATAEDSRQVLVSTVGDLIAAHRITAGARSLQAIGQMSDETLQHLSRTHVSPATDFGASVGEKRERNDQTTSSGRTLGASNVRTL